MTLPEPKLRTLSPDTSCDLCGLPLGSSSAALKKGKIEHFFCCQGCKHVFAVLWESGIRGDAESLQETELFRRCLEMGIIPYQGDQDSQKEIENIPPDEITDLHVRVSPFWCGSCCYLVETALSRLKGVVEVRASFASDTVNVRYMPRYASSADVERCLAGIGYPVAREEKGAEKSMSRSFLFRLGISAFLTANVMMITLALYSGFFSAVSDETHRILAYPSLLLTLIVLAYGGYPIHTKALTGARQGVVSMETLISLSSITAFGLGIYGTYSGSLHLYFETACMLITLVLLGKFIEALIKERVMADAHRLEDLAPRKARLFDGEGGRFVAAEALKEGNECLIQSGEKVPLDGVVVEGEGLVDESMITGESRPVYKRPGEEVIGATVLLDGSIKARVERPRGETTIDRMAELVKESLLHKGPMELPADRISRIFVPLIVCLAVVVAVWLLAVGFPLNYSLLRAVTVMVIACPCTLGIAIPLAKVAAVGLAGRRGIVVKDPVALQAVSKLTTIMFDKTGTLTEGKFSVCDVVAKDGSGTQPVELAAALERESRHYLARAIVKEAEDRRLPIPRVEKVEHIPGKGVKGLVKGKEVLVGSRAFFQGHGIDIPAELANEVSQHESQGQTVVFIGWERQIRGFIGLGDTARVDSALAVSRIRSMGLIPWLISGDSKATTAAVAQKLGIDYYRGGLLPDEKAEIIRDCQSRGHKVAMVGDGINDALALAGADFGIALAVGKNIGLDASHVSIMSDSPIKVLDVLEIGRITNRVIRQNLFFSLVYNACAIPLAVAGVVNPLTAVTAMLISSLTVVINSYRISRK
ncbi:MAG: heavy metal translocating P-type ATPase [Deltaproteobacteria bacterium]|nr:heavy metal translocating P-type ATPase [Deltaproteobacteria bacterium]